MKPRSKFRRWMPWIAIVAILVAAFAYLFSELCERSFFFREMPFADRKAELEKVVEEVRQMHLEPGGDFEFKMDDLANAKSLHPINPNTYFTNGAGLVWARVTSGGSLRVAIMTYDWHHCESSGFAYSDGRLAPEMGEDGYLLLDVPGPLDCPNPSTEIDAHWWKVKSTRD